MLARPGALRYTGGVPLSAADRARLERALDTPGADVTAGLFAPGSITWRVNREAVVLLGGGRALLLQVAHPLVAAGVAAHSDFRRRPLDRLWRTLDLMLTIVFADGEAALRAVHGIEAVHARVHGTLAEAVGPFPRGTPYRADDPALLLWVFATLVDTAVLVYERFVGPLDDAERAAHYDEAKRVARLLGVPPALVPPTVADFRAYVDDMVRGDVLTVGREAREVAAAILWPPLPPVVRETVRASHVTTTALLPPVLRERYGLPFGAASEAAVAAMAATSRRVLPLLPDVVRFLPHARRAAARWTA